MRIRLKLFRGRTRAAWFGVILCGMFAGNVDAQGIGYAVAGAGGVSGFFGSRSSAYHAAGGGEFRFATRAGIGAEGGVFGNSGSLLVMVSANGTFHVSRSPGERGPSPFLTGGYTRLGIGYGEGAFNTWNLGGGVAIWGNGRSGFRLEFRDHVRPDFRGTVHYWVVRAGVCLR
jgi:hypothetical protein